MRDKRTTNNEQQQLKIELLSQWKLEAESRNIHSVTSVFLQLNSPELDKRKYINPSNRTSLKEFPLLVFI